MGTLQDITRMFVEATEFDQDLEDWKEHFTLDTAGKAIATKADTQISLAKTNAFVGSKLANNTPKWY